MSSKGSIGTSQRGLQQQHQQHQQHQQQYSSTFVKKAFCLAFGIIRPILLKLFNYQEHVSEYGIHWNFFVTLFCIWTIADLLETQIRFLSGMSNKKDTTGSNFRKLYSYTTLIISVLTLGLYQYALLSFGFTDYLFSENRIGIVSANKEGIFSLIGNLAIYFIVQYFSTNYIFNQNASDKPIQSSYNINLKLVEVLRFPIILLWGLWYLCDTHMQPTSRRLCNVPYVVLILALGSSLLYAIALVEVLFAFNIGIGKSSSVGSMRVVEASPPHDIKVCINSLEYINRSQLFVFLFANVLTGLINMSMETIITPHHVSIVVLIAYSYLVLVSGWGTCKVLEYFTSVAREGKK